MIHGFAVALAALSAQAGAMTQPAAAVPAVALVWGGGAERAQADGWLRRWQLEAKDYGEWIALAAGYPKVVASADVRGMKPGFFVVLLGVCSPQEAPPPLALLKSLQPGTYGRDVMLELPATACPRLPQDGAPLDRRELKRSGLVLTVLELRARTPAMPGGESARGAGETIIVALLRNQAGERVDFQILGGTDRQPEGGFGSWSEATLGPVEGGRIVVEETSHRATVECGVIETSSVKRAGIRNGRLDVVDKSEQREPGCIQ